MDLKLSIHEEYYGGDLTIAQTKNELNLEKNHEGRESIIYLSTLNGASLKDLNT